MSRQQEMFAADAARLILHIFEAGWTCTLGEAFRTPEMAEIYAKDGRGIRNSQHTKRMAIDLNLFHEGNYITATEAYRPFGEYWESLDPMNRWGGRFQRADGNHFERRDK